MVSLDPLENPVRLESLVLLVSLVPLDPKEIWVQLDPKEVLVCKDLEETLVNLEILVNLEKWVHLEKMELMEKRVVLDHQDHLALLDSLDPEENPV